MGIEPVILGTNEVIKYLKEENETYENMLGDSAKLLIEYRVNQLAIEALEEKLSREATSDRICMAAGLMQAEKKEKDDGTYEEK